MGRKGCPNKFSKKIEFICGTCNKKWLDYPSRIGRKKFCSKGCATLSRKDILFKKGNKINIGRKYTEETKRKISVSNKKAWLNPKLRKKSSKDRIGKKNPRWVKKAINYSTIHKWLVRIYGKADKCEAVNCLRKTIKFEYALLKGKKYERKRKNFIMLCLNCHRIYDNAKQNTIIL